ncbi:hypothetical protein J3R74_001086 [Puniceicoccus vermicola]|uniref:Sialate O-acetylesterase domain-containing protein n=1 Tax=Puniceicoccus vermicola TaxID=388746 RepID=A0A7X1AYA4_9BACT|nr:hypothetical protein [Puniceicoccus vermicola]
MVNDSQIAVAEDMEKVIFVKRDGLTSLEDRTHFDTRSQIEFGKRYADAYLSLEDRKGGQ